jgi:hypothetical protein
MNRSVESILPVTKISDTGCRESCGSLIFLCQLGENKGVIFNVGKREEFFVGPYLFYQFIAAAVADRPNGR